MSHTLCPGTWSPLLLNYYITQIQTDWVRPPFQIFTIGSTAVNWIPQEQLKNRKSVPFFVTLWYGCDFSEPHWEPKIRSFRFICFPPLKLFIFILDGGMSHGVEFGSGYVIPSLRIAAAIVYWFPFFFILSCVQIVQKKHQRDVELLVGDVI
jgi:hypothetical protein